MSTIILGRLAKRPQLLEEDGKKHWTEALAAVIPGEALAAYSAMAAFFTAKGTEVIAAVTGSESEDDAAQDPAAAFEHEWVVLGLTVAILLLIPVAYAASAGAFWTRLHAIRWAVAMAAFVVWLWLLPLSPWDSLVDLDGAVRAGVGIVAAFGIVVFANYLFKRWPI